MDGDEGRLQTGLWVETQLHTLTIKGIPYYIANKGAYASGMVMVKLSNLEGQCKLLQQQRDLDGVLGWMGLFDGGLVEERQADEYIRRSIDRDPDLWVVEVEDREMKNPFEGKVF